MICKKINLYEGRDDVTLTTYLLNDSKELLDGKSRPAVIVCPGGAYLNLSDREGEPVALAFANMGYNAFVLHYSVYSKSAAEDMFATDVKEVREHCIFPKPMQDIGAAMLYIREHSQEWHVNMDQVAVCGFSAGAHNCAMYSVYWNKPEIAGFFNVDPSMLKPAACILGYALTDYLYMKASTFAEDADEFNKQLFRKGNVALLGEEMPSIELLEKVSPAIMVDENTPPTFLWATSEDNLVPVQHTILMANALANAKVPFEVHIFESGMHGLSTATESSAGNLWEVNPEASKWVPMCSKWLKKRLRLDLAEKPVWAEFVGLE